MSGLGYLRALGRPSAFLALPNGGWKLYQHIEAAVNWCCRSFVGCIVDFFSGHGKAFYVLIPFKIS